MECHIIWTIAADGSPQEKYRQPDMGRTRRFGLSVKRTSEMSKNSCCRREIRDDAKHAFGDSSRFARLRRARGALRREVVENCAIASGRSGRTPDRNRSGPAAHGL